jgi:predicted ferric reductase
VKRVHANPNPGIHWILLYATVVVAPLFIMLIGPRPEGRPLLRDLSVAIAFCSMSLMGLQFVLTARIPSIKRPFGSDVVYFFHHQVSVVAVVLVVLHLVLLGIDNGSTWGLLAFWSSPLRARFAVAGLASLFTLIGLSLFRRQLRIEYITWRITHGLLAMGAAAFAMTHMQLVGIYLASPWKRALWSAYAACWIGTLAYARVVRPIVMKLRPYEIARIDQERGDAWTITLRPIGHAGARFAPGQFAWLTVARSPFADLEHPFSYASSAEHPESPSFTIKAVGDFTSRIARFAAGTRVYLDGPFGAFSPDRHPEVERFVFIAGGIGITPFMSMLRTMRDRSDARSCTLIYAARSLDAMTFLEELRALDGALNLEIHLVPSVADDTWRGFRGRVSLDVLRQAIPEGCQDSGCEVYLCGPIPMMDAVEASLVHLGVSMGRIHSERFNLA